MAKRVTLQTKGPVVSGYQETEAKIEAIKSKWNKKFALDRVDECSSLAWRLEKAVKGNKNSEIVQIVNTEVKPLSPVVRLSVVLEALGLGVGFAMPVPGHKYGGWDVPYEDGCQVGPGEWVEGEQGVGYGRCNSLEPYCSPSLLKALKFMEEHKKPYLFIEIYKDEKHEGGAYTTYENSKNYPIVDGVITAYATIGFWSYVDKPKKNGNYSNGYFPVYNEIKRVEQRLNEVGDDNPLTAPRADKNCSYAVEVLRAANEGNKKEIIPIEEFIKDIHKVRKLEEKLKRDVAAAL